MFLQFEDRKRLCPDIRAKVFILSFSKFSMLSELISNNFTQLKLFFDVFSTFSKKHLLIFNVASKAQFRLFGEKLLKICSNCLFFRANFYFRIDLEKLQTLHPSLKLSFPRLSFLLQILPLRT